MIDQLLKPEVQKFIKDHQYDDPFSLSLKLKLLNDFPKQEAISQIQSLQKAKHKLPGWIKAENIIWPPPVSIEQSSSEITAKFKSELLYGKSIADLTGGMGVDTFYFSNIFDEAHYVESNPELAEIAQHNFDMLKKENIHVYNDTAEGFLEKCNCHFDAVFLDPSRRNKSRKVFKIEDCTPNLFDIIPKCLEKTDQLLIKLSPMIDLTQVINDLSPLKIWVVSVRNEVKEVLCLIQSEKRKSLIFAVDLQTHVLERERSNIVFGFSKEEEANTENSLSLPLTYLYEPSAAILKSGAFKLVGYRFGLKKLHINTHLYTSDKLVKDFPGRIFLLNSQLKNPKKYINRIAPSKRINVLTRNYPLSPVQLKKKLGLQDGGDHYLIGTTVMDGKKVLLFCDRK